tara:strand:- start:269 stop:658 length:390 start_codon:yes stop_codon:yes gene_type:complete
MVWYSFFGSNNSAFPETFPYTAKSPTLYKTITFTEEELWNEVDRVLIENENNSYTPGQALWYNLSLVANMNHFYDPEINMVIQEYNMSKQFSIPPARSTEEMDYHKMVVFSAIDEEVMACQNRKQEDGK